MNNKRGSLNWRRVLMMSMEPDFCQEEEAITVVTSFYDAKGAKTTPSKAVRKVVRYFGADGKLVRACLSFNAAGFAAEKPSPAD